MSQQTIFDKIIAKEIPAEIVYEDEQVLGFKDISPQAKVHLLFIYKNQSRDIVEMMEKQPQEAMAVLAAMTKYCKQQQWDESGFRIVTNCGADAGQTVFHTHFHLLAGEPLGKFGK